MALLTIFLFVLERAVSVGEQGETVCCYLRVLCIWFLSTADRYEVPTGEESVMNETVTYGTILTEWTACSRRCVCR